MQSLINEQVLSLKQLGITQTELTKIAFACGFCTRLSGKIRTEDVLIHMCAESIKGTVSYNDIAARIEACTGVQVSRQAYWERLDESGVRLFQQVLAHIINSKLHTGKVPGGPLLETATYRRILLQDSTIIQIPANLFAVFSGVRNATHTVCNARIQCVYDLKAGTFLKFTIDPYSVNDLSVTLDIDLQQGDLVLRDRGYFTIESIQKHRAVGADCIFRYKHGAAIFDAKNGKPINLLTLLKKRRSLDLPVLIGTHEKLPVRLLAAPVSEEIANLRRMRAKKEASGHNPSAEILALMGWSIFLTTINDPATTFQQILALYGLRWRIENIFKTWKSNFNFERLHRVSEEQLRILLTARFIMLAVLYQGAFRPLAQFMQAKSDRILSLMKFMRYISRNISRLPAIINGIHIGDAIYLAVLKYCVYEKRRRQNFVLRADDILAHVDQRTALA